MGVQAFYGQLKTDFVESARGHESTQQIVSMRQGTTLKSPLFLNAQNFETSKEQIRNQDRLTIFNTIGDGDVFWEGQLKSNDLHGAFPAYTKFETLLEDRVFMRMCHQALPATLEKLDGRIIHGNMHAFWEQGAASAPYLYDFCDQGYGSLNEFEDGDTLRVFSRVTDGQILWRGDMDADNNATKTGKVIEFKKLGKEIVDGKADEYKQSVRRPPAELLDRWQIIGFPAMIERDI